MNTAMFPAIPLAPAKTSDTYRYTVSKPTKATGLSGAGLNVFKFVKGPKDRVIKYTRESHTNMPNGTVKITAHHKTPESTGVKAPKDITHQQFETLAQDWLDDLFGIKKQSLVKAMQVKEADVAQTDARVTTEGAFGGSQLTDLGQAVEVYEQFKEVYPKFKASVEDPNSDWNMKLASLQKSCDDYNDSIFYTVDHVKLTGDEAREARAEYESRIAEEEELENLEPTEEFVPLEADDLQADIDMPVQPKVEAVQKIAEADLQADIEIETKVLRLTGAPNPIQEDCDPDTDFLTELEVDEPEIDRTDDKLIDIAWERYQRATEEALQDTDRSLDFLDEVETREDTDALYDYLVQSPLDVVVDRIKEIGNRSELEALTERAIDTCDREFYTDIPTALKLADLTGARGAFLMGLVTQHSYDVGDERRQDLITMPIGYETLITFGQSAASEDIRKQADTTINWLIKEFWLGDIDKVIDINTSPAQAFLLGLMVCELRNVNMRGVWEGAFEPETYAWEKAVSMTPTLDPDFDPDGEFEPTMDRKEDIMDTMQELNNTQELVEKARDIVDQAIDELGPMDMHLAHNLEVAVQNLRWALENINLYKDQETLWSEPEGGRA